MKQIRMAQIYSQNPLLRLEKQIKLSLTYDVISLIKSLTSDSVILLLCHQESSLGHVLSCSDVRLKRDISWKMDEISRVSLTSDALHGVSGVISD